MDELKRYKLTKGESVVLSPEGKNEWTEREVSEYMAQIKAPGFYSMLKRIQVKETMFHYDTMTNFERIK